MKRLCHIRGKMRKKVWVNTVRGLLPFPSHAAYPLSSLALRPKQLTLTAPRDAQGDIILLGLRDYQDEKADVILKCALARAVVPAPAPVRRPCVVCVVRRASCAR